MSHIRILVLTSSTGGGHDARAEAFAEWCFRLYRHSVDVRIEQMLEKSSTINRTGVGFYNWIQKRCPLLHTGFYAFVELLSYLNRNSVHLGRHYYTKVLREYRPHLVFSVHDCLNRGYFQLARKILGADQVRCATYCGEFSGGWGYSRNWIEPSADLYISRTPTARDFAVKMGISPEKALVRGHFMHPRAYIEVIAPAAKAQFRQQTLGLHPHRFTVFLATGTNGANNHFELLPALLRHAHRCQAIIICGKNHDTYNQLVQWRAQHPEFACHIEGFSQDVHLLMQASDVIVTRGGTTTCAKALHFNCPIVFNAFGGIMPQEKLTWKFFHNGNAALKIENADDFVEIIDDWMSHPAHYAQLRDRFLLLRYDEDPAIVIDELVNLAGEVAGRPYSRSPFPPRAETDEAESSENALTRPRQEKPRAQDPEAEPLASRPPVGSQVPAR